MVSLQKQQQQQQLVRNNVVFLWLSIGDGVVGQGGSVSVSSGDVVDALSGGTGGDPYLVRGL